MSDIIPAIEKRRARRALDERNVEREVQERILTAATYAPSCFNKQPWRFLLVESEEGRAGVAEALPDGNYWAKKAPLYVLVATKPELDCNLSDRREYALFDVGMATMNLQLQAVEEGLVAHPIAGFDDTRLKRSFGIPEEYILITVVVLGYPGDSSELNEKHAHAETSARTREVQGQVISQEVWSFS
jgi:nitroreductase